MSRNSSRNLVTVSMLVAICSRSVVIWLSLREGRDFNAVPDGLFLGFDYIGDERQMWGQPPPAVRAAQPSLVFLTAGQLRRTARQKSGRPLERRSARVSA